MLCRNFVGQCSYFQLLNQTGCNKEELDAALHDLQYNMRGILRIEKKKEVVKAEIKDKEKLFALMDKKQYTGQKHKRGAL